MQSYKIIVVVCLRVKGVDNAYSSTTSSRCPGTHWEYTPPGFQSTQPQLTSVVIVGFDRQTGQEERI